MGIGKRIKEARERLGMTQSELAEIVGVTGSAITNYEKETSHPKEPIMYKLFDALQVDANFLFQDVVNIPKKINDVTFSEYENIIKKYRFISEYSPEGTETVDYILNREYKIAEQLAELENEPTSTPPQMRAIPYYQRLASAGTGQIVFDGVPVEKIEIPDIPECKRVSYAIGVNGNSMEPLYHDSDVLLIEPTCKIDVGEIGIFIIGDESYVKKLGKGKLISLNAGYGDIPLTEYSKCMGRVIDKISKHSELSSEDIAALQEGRLAAQIRKKKA